VAHLKSDDFSYPTVVISLSLETRLEFCQDRIELRPEKLDCIALIRPVQNTYPKKMIRLHTVGSIAAQ
jgi:hypothetical protein